MLEDYYKPFEDFDNAGVKNIFTRVFKKSVKKEQLLWHKDKKDRKSILGLYHRASNVGLLLEFNSWSDLEIITWRWCKSCS